MTTSPDDDAAEAENEAEMVDAQALEASAFRARSLELLGEDRPKDAWSLRVSAASIERALRHLPELSG